jgi:pimeloyl-ACP methyl ester carboxylesterase
MLAAGRIVSRRMELDHHRGGSGEPLVLIHEIGHTWRGWKPMLPLLEPRFDVLAVDLPG